MEQFFSENFPLRLVHIEGKNDEKLTFDDSFICYVSKIDVFEVVFCTF